MRVQVASLVGELKVEHVPGWRPTPTASAHGCLPIIAAPIAVVMPRVPVGAEWVRRSAASPHQV
jgi:hypothetical protein